MREDMGSASPRLVTVSCGRKMSRDVRLDVELAALVSSVETTLYFQLLSANVSVSAVSDVLRNTHSVEAGGFSNLALGQQCE